MNKQLLAAAIALAVTHAVAQEAVVTSSAAVTPSGPSSLNEITVIGQKIDRSLQETVAGTSILDEVLIEDKMANNLSDVLDYASNVSMVNTGNYDSMTIRGIDIKGLAGGGTEVGSIFINDAYMPISVFNGNIPLWDVEQIVINKGPQSTTQGKNSLAGTVRLQNHRPVFFNQGSVQVGVGSDGWKNAGVMLNHAFSDTFAARLSAQHNRSDGQISNIYLNDDKHDYSKNSVANLQLSYEPSSDTSVLLSLGYIDDSRGVRLTCSDGNASAQYPCRRGELKANQAIKPHHDIDTDYQTLQITHRFSPNWTLKSITSRTHVRDDDVDDNTRYHPLAPNYPQAGGQPFAPSEGYNGWERDNLNQELRLNFENERLRSSTGVYWARNKTERFRAGSLPYDFKDFIAALDSSGLLSLEAGKEYLSLQVSENGGIYETRNIALFNDTDFDVNDKLTLNVGLRLDRETTKSKSQIVTKRADDLTTLDQSLPDSVQVPAYGTSLANAACALNPQLCGASFTQIVGTLQGAPLPGLNEMADAYLASTTGAGTGVVSTNHSTTILPKIGVSYDINNDLTVGYLYSRGYRSGGAGINIGTGQAFTFDPEYLDNHELSLKSTWLDGRLTLNANAYYARWKDQQVSVSGNTNPYDTQTANAGKSELYGAELDAYYADGSGLYGFANIAYNHSEFKEFIDNGVDYSGNRFPDTPKLSGALAVGYQAQNGWNGNITTRLSQGSYQRVANERKSPGYGMTDVRVGYAKDQWQINAFVNNVFNRKVEHRYWDFAKYGTAYASVSTFSPERSYGISFKYDF